ncbi:MAG TPA: adenylate/guanylate cyclase domain-containing protein [Bradyrhizobium sp.]|nr:adenylate/guanylate cyclase domain-containing protein [Bradyrhizobium sp.]
MTAVRKLTTILAADVAGYSRLTGIDEEGTLKRIRALRSELIDPNIAAHRGRIVKTTGDGLLIEFLSVVDAVRCAIDVQRGMMTRNADFVPEKRIEFRVGIHLGDVIVEDDGDLMGDGVNIAARLEGIAEPGNICLSDAAYQQVRDRLKEEFVNLGDKELKNIVRPVRVFSINVSGNAETSRKEESSPPIRLAKPRLSIVVLPFVNIGGDPEQEYFVDGITESLTTDLSRIAGSFVIARNTAFTYKGKSADLKQIGRELNVRYVLEGSIQRGGNRMRLNIQLIDAETGNHLWAERFDKPLADLFDMQDEILARLASQLGTQLIAAEAHRAERASNPDSMDLYFQGMSCFNMGISPQHLAPARGYFERALALDPGNIEALTGLAHVDAQSAGYFMTDDRAARFAAAEATLTKTLALAPNHAVAHYLLGIVLIFTNRAARGIAEFERALALDRNLAAAHGQIGLAKYFIGRGAETEAHVQEALRLSPVDTFAHQWMFFMGLGKQQMGAYEDAVDRFRRAVEGNRNHPLAHFFLAAALALLGRQDEARAAAQEGLALDPTFTVRRYRAGPSTDNPTYLAGRERNAEGMLKAGVPEG